MKRNAARGVPAVGHFHDTDLRYKVWDIYEQHQANAAVYMLMDVSGSMTTSKKYIAKSFFFWMVRFLQLKYQKVEMVFIAHDTEAQVVPEQDFFALAQGGGTRCSSAYQLALTSTTASPGLPLEDLTVPFLGWDNCRTITPSARGWWTRC